VEVEVPKKKSAREDHSAEPLVKKQTKIEESPKYQKQES